MTLRRRPPPSPSALVKRKRSGEKQVRKTVYFLPRTVERLDRYAFDHRMKVWEVVEAAVAEYLDRVSPRSKRRTSSAPPSPPAPPRRRTTAPPSSAPVASRRRTTAPPS